MTKPFLRGAFLGCAAALLGTNAVFANDASFTSGLTGDWDGARTELKNQGWQFQVKGTFEDAWNPSGGDHQSAAGAGELDFAALADLGKLVGDDGGSIEANITKRFGANLVDVAGLNTLMQPQEIYGRGDIWRLTQLSFAQDLFNKAINIEFGRMNPGADFDVIPCNFENLAFCGSTPGNVDGDYWFNSPVSQWGARVKANVSDTVDLAAGIYQVNPKNLVHGFSFDFSGGQGELFPFELEWKPALVAGLPGDYQIGGWHSSMQAPDVFFDINHDPLAVTGLPALMDHGRDGLFLDARQQIMGEAPPKDAASGSYGKGLTLFLKYMQSDRRTSIMDKQFAVGATYKGAIPSRADDEIALAFGTTHINDRLAEGEALSPVEPVQHTEYAVELDYRAQIVKGAELSPNLQYIVDPGGVSARHDILVVGVKGIVTL
ncbi:MAG TPA: carbohydrate porin [Rhizomicrobium sp.]|jgi:porin